MRRPRRRRPPSLNKGGGEKKGGSEAFFTNSAENFLAAIIYFFVNFHPVGFKDGRKLRRFILHEGKKLEIVIRNWDDYNAIDKDGNVVLDFVDEKGNDVSTDEDRMFVDLNGYSYKDRTGKLVRINRCWYEDRDGNEVEPDTVTGEYSDMPHVLSFLGRPYDQVFNILMQDDKIASLMAPFKSAYENKANDQLEGMVGTLRVNAARLVSPEAYWVFTGDDFDLKISDREHRQRPGEGAGHRLAQRIGAEPPDNPCELQGEHPGEHHRGRAAHPLFP